MPNRKVNHRLALAQPETIAASDHHYQFVHPAFAKSKPAEPTLVITSLVSKGTGRRWA